MIVLIWLGSGFAFALGAVIGGWLMKSIMNPIDSYDEKHAESLATMERRNELLQTQNELMNVLIDTVGAK